MYIKSKITSYINTLEKAKKLESQIRKYFINKYGEELFNTYIDDIIRDNILNPDIDGTMRLIEEVVNEIVILK